MKPQELPARQDDADPAPAPGAESLLGAVVEAIKCLVERESLAEGMEAAIQVLATISGHDRGYVFRVSDADNLVELVCTWTGDGLLRLEELSPTNTFAASDFDEVLSPLRRGDIYGSSMRDKTGANAELNQLTRTLSDLMAPIMVNGQLWGAVGVDACYAERLYSQGDRQALRGVASAMAAAIQRDDARRAQRRAETDRLMRAEADAAALKRSEGLLNAVVESTRCLVDAEHVQTGLQQAIAALGSLSGHDRAYAFRVEGPTVILLCEWSGPGYPGIEALAKTRTFQAADYGEVLDPLQRGEVYGSLTHEKSGANADFNTTVQTLSDLMAPIFVNGDFWGMVGLDACREQRVYTAADRQALRGAANAIAAALQRDQARRAEKAAEIERLRRAEEDATALRAREALLRVVAEASRLLLGGSSFDTAIAEVMQLHGEALGVGRVRLLQDLGDLPGSERGAWRLTHEWTAPGVPLQTASGAAQGQHPSAQAIKSYQRGQSLVWRAPTADDAAPDAVTGQIGAQVQSTLSVPIVTSRGWWGLIAFDDTDGGRSWEPHELAVLETAAACVGAALQRSEDERRRSAEEREQARRAQRLARLLAAVAEAADTLIASRELHASVAQALALVGPHAGAQRAVLALLEWTPDDSELHGWQEVVAEWAAEGAIRQSSTGLRRVAMRRADASWSAVLAQLDKDGRLLMHMDDLDEPTRTEQASLGVAWTLCHPVITGGRLRALLGYDFGVDAEAFDEADHAALKTLASVIANAMDREDTERAAMEAERAQTRNTARMAALLSTVVHGSRALIDTKPEEFEQALLLWLRRLGQETLAQRATFYDFSTFPETGETTARMLCEWVRDGVQGSVPCSFAEPYVINPRGAEAVLTKLTSGQAVAFHTDEAFGPIREFLEAQGNATVLCVPLSSGGRTHHALSFDFAERRPVNAAELAVLETAADTLEAVLRRNEAAKQLLASREMHLALERKHSEQLRLINDALGGAINHLAQGAELDDFLRELLMAAMQACGAQTASVTVLEDGAPVLRALHDRNGWVDAAVLQSMRLQQMSVSLPALNEAVGLSSRWDPIQIDPQESWLPVTLQNFHRQQANGCVWLVPLRSAQELLGWVALGMADASPLPDSVLSLMRVLADPMAVALELTRLGEQAKAVAVAQERALAEQQRLAELQRANDALRRAALQLRPDAPLTDFLAALALEAATISGARSVGVFRYDAATEQLRMGAFISDGQVLDIATHPLMIQWRDPVPLAVSRPWIDALAGAEQLHFDNHQPPELHPWPISRAWHESLGHTRVIDVPLRAGGRLVGLLGQCFCGDQAAARFDLPQAQALAHLAALAIHQDGLSAMAQDALLNSERERAERERLLELSRANDALRMSMNALAESGSEVAFMRLTLQQIAQHAAAHTVWLFRRDGDGLLRLVGSSRAGRFSRQGEEGDPPAFRSGLKPVPNIWAGLPASERLIWRDMRGEVDEEHYNPATLAWHRAMGHQANALIGLISGSHQIGLVGMVFDHGQEPGSRQREMLRALCQPLTLALELTRLGAQVRLNAEQAAVLGERNRLAREIHDGIAQTFLAIDMQLRGVTTPAAVEQARQLSMQGLNDARRAVAALRPQQMQARSLPEALAVALPLWLSGHQLEYRLEQPNGWMAQPGAVEDQLFRLAQEAVHNIIKHARASLVRLELSQRPDELSMLIADDGVGMQAVDVEGHGFGLQSMQQRAASIGARLQWLSLPGKGTQVLVSLPRATT